MTTRNTYLPVPLSMPSWQIWCQRLAVAVNNILAGGQNITTSLTLNANATTTSFTDSRINSLSTILLSPTTLSAASVDWWIDSQHDGTAIIHHPSSVEIDQSFNVVILA